MKRSEEMSVLTSLLYCIDKKRIISSKIPEKNQEKPATRNVLTSHAFYTKIEKDFKDVLQYSGSEEYLLQKQIKHAEGKEKDEKQIELTKKADQCI